MLQQETFSAPLKVLTAMQGIVNAYPGGAAGEQDQEGEQRALNDGRMEATCNSGKRHSVKLRHKNPEAIQYGRFYAERFGLLFPNREGSQNGSKIPALLERFLYISNKISKITSFVQQRHHILLGGVAFPFVTGV